MNEVADLSFAPLSPERWADLEALFGPERGASSGCWCLHWRLPRKRRAELGRDGRKAGLRALVQSGPPPGILAYAGGQAIGWCAIAPRAATPNFNSSRVARPLEPESASHWAITCFYVASSARGRGLMRSLAEAACRHAFANGAAAVEACPVDTGRKLVWGEGYVGIASALKEAGFVEIARRSPARPLMRRLAPLR